MNRVLCILNIFPVILCHSYTATVHATEHGTKKVELQKLIFNTISHSWLKKNSEQKTRAYLVSSLKRT